MMGNGRPDASLVTCGTRGGPTYAERPLFLSPSSPPENLRRHALNPNRSTDKRIRCNSHRKSRSSALVGRRVRPVCARPPTSRSLRHSVELVRMSDDSGLGLGGLMLEWGSPGEEGVVPLGSTAGSCKEVGSSRFPT
ncbi:hypothetical protein GW17_00046774 [Ensete ventricosum]|nr:hypothetical protein GW17_00046774 [Ensete ventricosum]